MVSPPLRAKMDDVPPPPSPLVSPASVPHRSKDEKRDDLQAQRLDAARSIGMGAPAQSLQSWTPKELKPSRAQLNQAAGERGIPLPNFRTSQEVVSWLFDHPQKDKAPPVSLSEDKIDENGVCKLLFLISCIIACSSASCSSSVAVFRTLAR